MPDSPSPFSPSGEFAANRESDLDHAAWCNSVQPIHQDGDCNCGVAQYGHREDDGPSLRETQARERILSFISGWEKDHGSDSNPIVLTGGNHEQLRLEDLRDAMGIT